MTTAPQTRPRLLWPALLTLVGTLVLCTLGGWQVVRMQEKSAFITRLEDQAIGAPTPLPPLDALAKLDAANLDLMKVEARGRFVGDQVAGVRTTIASGPPGTRQLSGFGRWVFQGFELDSGETILVNRGFVPEARYGEITPSNASQALIGFLRAPEIRNAFTPADLPAKREFYTRDPMAIAASLGLTGRPFYLEAERRGDPMVPPAGVDVRELIERIPDNHLQYALTWFGLALTLVGVFAAYALQARRAPA